MTKMDDAKTDSLDELRKNSHTNPRNNEVKTCKLYVSNIPLHLELEEFRRIFKEDGDRGGAVSVYLPTPSSHAKYKWGFVEFSCQRDADAVIRNMNNTEPHYLNIKYTNSDKSSRNHSNSVPNRGKSDRQLIQKNQRNDSSSSETCDSKKDRNCRYQVTSHRRQLATAPHQDITNITLTISKDGQRKVQAHYESKKSELDHNPSDFDKLSWLVPLDICSVCGADAVKKCQACDKPYCSRHCALSDLKEHIKNCLSSLNSHIEAKSVRSTHHISDKTVEPSNDFKKQKVGQYNSNFFKEDHQKSPQQKPQVETEKQKSRVLMPLLALPYDTLTEICVTHVVSDDCWWGIKTSDTEKALSVFNQLEENCNGTNELIIPKLDLTQGLLCAALYSNEWCRAEIVSLSNNNRRATLRYLDYGNEEVVPVDHLRVLPSSLSHIPPLAFKMKLSKKCETRKKGMKDADKFHVQPVQVESDVWVVNIVEVDDCLKNRSGSSCQKEAQRNSFSSSAEKARNSTKNTASLSSQTQVSSKTTSSLSELNQIYPKATSSPINEETRTRPNIIYDNDSQTRPDTASHPNSETDVNSVKRCLSPFPPKAFTKVVISYKCEVNVYWISKKDDLLQLDYVLTELSKYCTSPSSKHPISLSPGSHVSAMFQGDWYRAKVVSVESCSDLVQVMFIDFGNEELCSRNLIKDIPDNLINIQPLAYKIQLCDKTSNKYVDQEEGTELSISPISQLEDCWLVYIEGDNSVQLDLLQPEYNKVPDTVNEAEPAVSHKRDCLGEAIKLESTKNIIDCDSQTSIEPAIPFNTFTKVKVVYKEENESMVYWVCTEANTRLFQTITKKVDDFCHRHQIKSILPKNILPGLRCAAIFQQDWYRCDVVSKDGDKVLVKFIDFGNEDICDVSDVKPLPDDLASTQPLAFKIKLAEGTSNIYRDVDFNEVLSIKPSSYNSQRDMWVVQVENEIHSSPQPKSTPLIDNLSSSSRSKLPPIPANCFTPVYVTHPINQSSMWVSELKRLKETEQILIDLNNHCNGNSSKKMSTLTSRMKCAALYMGDWYRGKVINTDPIQVKFVDYGNVEQVALSDIRKLPDSLTKIKPLAFMIKMSSEDAAKCNNLNVGSQLSIKPISRNKEGFGWFVELEGCDPDEESKITYISKSEQVKDVTSSETSDRLLPNDKSCLHSLLPLSKFSKVVVVYKDGEDEKGVYWVNLHSALESLLDMTSKLGQLSGQPVKPLNSHIYVHFVDDIWCRVRILSVLKDKVKVKYIDYGNEDEIDVRELNPLPPQYTFISPYAIKIRLSEGLKEQYDNMEMNTCISVKPISKDSDGVYSVMLEGPDVVLPSLPPTLVVENKNESYLNVDLLESAVEGGQCYIIVNKVYDSVALSKTNLSGSIVVPKYARHLKHIESQLNQLTSTVNFTPDFDCKRGTMVGYKDSQGILYRANVISSKSESTCCQLSLIDYGRVESCVEVMSPLPLDLQRIPEAGVICTLSSTNNFRIKVDVGSVLKCSNLMRKGSGTDVECKVDCMAGNGDCVISRWLPCYISSCLPNSVSCQSGCHVVISAITSKANTIYIQPLSPENVNALYSLILQTDNYINGYTGSGRHKANVGDVVACYYEEEEKYYRAVITRIYTSTSSTEQLYESLFIDFGNTTTVTSDQIKPLPDNIRNMTSCCIKVSLEGVKAVDVDDYPEIKTELVNYVNTQDTLNCKYEDLSCVTLSLEGARGVTLNSILTATINKQLKDKDKSGRRLSMDDIIYVDWKVGSVLTVLIVSADVTSNRYLAINSNIEDVSAIETLTSTLSQYATCEMFNSNYEYRPCTNELVIAHFEEDNMWYRACVKRETVISSNEEMCLVYFIDYGNTSEVKPQDIRPMTEKLLSLHPVPIRTFKLQGIEEKQMSYQVVRKLSEMFVDASSHQVTVSHINPTTSLVTVDHPMISSILNSFN